MIIYGIPGLGADERVFRYLSLGIEPIHWLSPVANESLHSYVKRLIVQIDQTKPFILLGVSFGGMVAVEMNKLISPEKTIIISSAATRDELPVLAKVIGKTGIINWLPGLMLKPPSFLANYFFGLQTVESKGLLKAIIKETDMHFLKWAVSKVMNWSNIEIPPNLIRLHGDKDRILYMKKGIQYEVIRGGGHLMIVEQAQQIETCLEKYLSRTDIKETS